MDAPPQNRALPQANTQNDEQTRLALEKFVSDAIEATGRGTPSRHYQMLLSQLTAPGAERWYRALTKCASLIHSQSDGYFSALLTSIFAFDYRTAPLERVRAHVDLLGQLALANSGFILPCFRLFCQSFKQEEGDTQVHPLLHQALRQLLQLSPVAAGVLFPVLLETYPHLSQNVTVQEVYVKNLLILAEYAEPLRPRILGLILEKLVILDVEVGGAERSNSEVDDSKHAGEEAECRDKLDILMCMLFEYVKIICENKSASLADSTWDCLAAIFEKSILKTQKARYLPFLIFYHASKASKYADKFMRRLLQKALDPQTPDPERFNCAAYLASFIGRAGFLQMMPIQFVFSHLLRWLHVDADHAGSDDVKVGVASTSQHLVFYALFQAMMYIFNKRIENEDSASLLGDDAANQFRTMVSCSLNPLRYCSAPIVFEFTSRLRALDILDATEIMSANRELTDGPGKLLAADLLNDIFFLAFEPYTLPKSRGYISSDIYIEYTQEYQPREHGRHPEAHSRSCSPVSNTRGTSSPLLPNSSPLLRTPLCGSPNPAPFQHHFRDLPSPMLGAARGFVEDDTEMSLSAHATFSLGSRPLSALSLLQGRAL